MKTTKSIDLEGAAALHEAHTIMQEIRQIQSKPNFSKEDSSRVDSLLAVAEYLAPVAERAVRHTKLSLAERRAGIDSPTRSSEFDKFLRWGKDAISEETRALGVTTDTAGGYLVADEFSDRLYSMLKVYDPLFDEAVVTMVETATGGPFAIPLLNDVASSASVIAENATSTVADLGPFDQVVLAKAPTWRSPLVKVSMELAQDSAYPIDELLAEAFAVQFQRGIGASLLTTLIAGAGLGVTGGATAITIDNLFDLYGSVDPEYLESPKAAWLMRHSTLVAIRKLEAAGLKLVPYMRDAAGRPLLLDLPVFICPSMPAIGTGAKSVLLGDIGSLIVRRVADSVRVRRLGERYATELALGFLAYVRVNAGVAKASGADAPVKWLAHA